MADENDLFLRVYFALDASASMSGAPMEALRQGCESLLRVIVPAFKNWGGVQTSALAYESRVFSLWRDLPIANVEISSVSAGGTSAIGLAAVEIVKWLDADRLKGDTHSLAIFLTDGGSTEDLELVQHHLNMLHEQCELWIVGCGRDADLTLLAPFFDETFSLVSENKDSMLARMRAVEEKLLQGARA